MTRRWRRYLKYCQLETDLLFHVRATLAGRRFLSDMRLDESPVERPLALASERAQP